VDERLILHTFVVGELQVNCYVFGDSSTKEVILIDPGAEPERIKTFLKKSKLVLKYIVLTHGHYDHIGALDNFFVPVYVQSRDVELLVDSSKNLSAFLGEPKCFHPVVRILEDKNILLIGKFSLEVIHTPGHTQGGICLKTNKILFSGDTLFYRSIGRTDLPGASLPQLLSSIRNRIMCLAPEILVFPGHGQQTTIGEEKEENQFL